MEVLQIGLAKSHSGGCRDGIKQWEKYLTL